MTLTVVRGDGYIQQIENVESFNFSKEYGNRLNAKLTHGSVSIPYQNLVSVCCSLTEEESIERKQEVSKMTKEKL